MPARIFKFQKIIKYYLTEDDLNNFTHSLGCKSFEELTKMSELVISGERDIHNDKGYAELDALILPNIDVEIFFNNFENAGMLFKDFKNREILGSTTDDFFQKIQIYYFALWRDQESQQEFEFELGLEAQVSIDTVEDVDFIDPYANSNSDIQFEFEQCQYMFTFHIRDLKCDNVEDSENSWVVGV